MTPIMLNNSVLTMILKNCLLIFLFLSHNSLLGSEEKPTICLSMIVKDESAVIARCLESVKPLIDYWVIVDTGSSDGTQEIIKEYYKDIPGELFERPWVDFAHNRNEALAFAKDKGDYILFIDADEVLEYSDEFQKPHLDKDYYYIETNLMGTKYKRVQLVSTRLPWEWIGVLHEYLHAPNIKTSGILSGVTNIARPEGNRSKDPDKYKKDAAVLEVALQKEPNNARYLFYLAQSYRDAGEHEKAIEAYQRRIALQGWQEEVFWSLLQIAIMKEILEKPADEVIAAYKIAYVYRPTRAEPLYRLANYYRNQKDFASAHATASLGLSLQKPDDVLFVEDWIYQYGLLLEYSIATYWTDRFVESLLATQLILALPGIPDNYTECAKGNLVWIHKKLKEKQQGNTAALH